MSFRVSSCLRVCLAVAVFGWAGLRPGLALAQGRSATERPESPAPAATESRPGGNRPSAYHNGLLRLEEQLSRSFQFLKPNSSLEGLPTPPLPARPAGPVLNQRARDLLEQRKNWAFVNPDDLTAMPKAEEFLNLPEYGSDGAEKKHASSIERFYQDLERKKSALAKREPLAPNDPGQLRSSMGVPNDSDSADDLNLPGGVRESEKTLKRLLKGQNSASVADGPGRGLIDILGLGQRQTTPEEDLAQKVYLKGFQDWLNRSAVPPGNNPANPLAALDPARQNQPGVIGYNPLAPMSRPDNYDPSLGAANPTLLVSSPQDATAKVLNQWNPLYAAPKVEPPKTLPPSPVFDVPRRKF